MKKRLNEQNNFSEFLNKTVNLYRDNQYKDFIATIKIDGIKKVPTKEIGPKAKNIGVLENSFWELECSFLEPTLKKDTIKLIFSCGGNLPGFTKMMKSGLYTEKGQQLFSSDFEEKFKKKFCAVSKGGTIVPKADFISKTSNDDTGLTENKRIVRLTESDLMIIVKRVIHEQKTKKDLSPGQSRQCPQGGDGNCLEGVTGNIKFDRNKMGSFYGKSIYKVKTGDTISKIFEKMGRTMDEDSKKHFMKINQLGNNEKSLKENDVVLFHFV